MSESEQGGFERLRELTDPVRFEIWNTLMTAGSMRGSRIVRAVPSASGALTAHMRQMLRVGLVEVVEEGKRTSSTTYRAIVKPITWNLAGGTEFEDLTVRTFERLVADQHAAGERRWQEEKRAGIWSDQWQTSQVSRDYRLILTPRDCDELDQDLADLFDKYKDRSDTNRANAPAGAQHVVATVVAYPRRIPR